MSAQIVMLTAEFTGQQLEHRVSAMFAGLSLTSIVFLIHTGQVAVYFWTRAHKRDSVWIKGFVVFMWIVQALESALSSHMTAIAHARESGMSVEQKKRCLWEWAAYIGTCATTECLVHGYFISRIYILETTSNKSHIISITLYIILALEGAFGILSALSYATFNSTEYKVVVSLCSLPAWFGLSILMDILISITIYCFLKRDSPFVSTRLNVLVGRLTKFCIQTGLITSLVTGITVALWIVAQLEAEHLLMCFPLGGIYATCLMANLIARESYFDVTSLGNDAECLGIEPGIVFATRADVEEIRNEISSFEMKSAKSSDIST